MFRGLPAAFYDGEDLGELLKQFILAMFARSHLHAIIPYLFPRAMPRLQESEYPTLSESSYHTTNYQTLGVG